MRISVQKNKDTIVSLSITRRKGSVDDVSKILDGLMFNSTDKRFPSINPMTPESDRKANYFSPVYCSVADKVKLSLNPFKDSFMVGILHFKDEIQNKEEFLRDWERFLSGDVYDYLLTERHSCPHCGSDKDTFITSCSGIYKFDSIKEVAVFAINNIDNFINQRMRDELLLKAE